MAVSKIPSPSRNHESAGKKAPSAPGYPPAEIVDTHYQTSILLASATGGGPRPSQAVSPMDGSFFAKANWLV
jgi:hypothetical protein